LSTPSEKAFLNFAANVLIFSRSILPSRSP
jgi:hypothetical protein